MRSCEQTANNRQMCPFKAEHVPEQSYPIVKSVKDIKRLDLSLQFHFLVSSPSAYLLLLEPIYISKRISNQIARPQHVSFDAIHSEQSPFLIQLPSSIVPLIFANFYSFPRKNNKPGLEP